jgi:chromosome segregation ATPase
VEHWEKLSISKLDLSKCSNLTRIPPGIGKLKEVQLVLPSNVSKITFPPGKICTEGPAAVLAYLNGFNVIQKEKDDLERTLNITTVEAQEAKAKADSLKREGEQLKQLVREKDSLNQILKDKMNKKVRRNREKKEVFQEERNRQQKRINELEAKVLQFEVDEKKQLEAWNRKESELNELRQELDKAKRKIAELEASPQSKEKQVVSKTQLNEIKDLFSNIENDILFSL